jgi:hypothetical protein
MEGAQAVQDGFATAALGSQLKISVLSISMSIPWNGKPHTHQAAPHLAH